MNSRRKFWWGSRVFPKRTKSKTKAVTVVCTSAGGPSFVAGSEGVEVQAVTGGTVWRICQQLAMRKTTITITITITVDGGGRRGKTAAAFSTDMTSKKTNGGERSENDVRDLHVASLFVALLACLLTCWLACELVGFRCLMQFNFMTTLTVLADQASGLRNPPPPRINLRSICSSSS